VKIVVASGVLGAFVLLTVACGESSRSLNPTAPSAVVVEESFSSSAESGPAGGKPANPGKPDDKGKPEDPGKPDDKGKPADPGKPDDKGKPEDPGKPDDKGKPADPPPSVPAPPSITSPLPPPSNTSPPVNGSPVSPHLPTNPNTGVSQIEGLIEGIGASSITVNGHSVEVPSTAVIRHGSHAVAFADLQVGDRVHVRAVKQGAALEASEIKLQDAVGDDDDDDPDDSADPDDEEEDGNGPGSVWVTLIDGTASEAGGDTGTFRLTRNPSAEAPLTATLTVNFTVTGSALNGTDYTAVAVTATFAAGEATVDVVVEPLADAFVESAETVILTLTADPAYAVGTPSSATVTIAAD
jgi:hypothetical protein